MDLQFYTPSTQVLLCKSYDCKSIITSMTFSTTYVCTKSGIS